MPGAVESYKLGYLDGYSACSRHVARLLESACSPEQVQARLKQHYANILAWRDRRDNDAPPEPDAATQLSLPLSG